MMKIRSILTTTAFAMTLSFAAYAGDTSISDNTGNTQQVMHTTMKQLQSDMDNHTNTPAQKSNDMHFAAQQEIMHELVEMKGVSSSNRNHQRDVQAENILKEYQTD